MSRTSILPYNTFKVDHTCKSISRIKNLGDLRNVLSRYNDALVIGGGSNILITRDLKQDVLLMDMQGIEVVEEDKRFVEVEVAAGTQWNELVKWAINNGFGGIENLSLIPGKCGAAPMQNIGAYGVELKDVFIHLEAVDRKSGKLLLFDKKDCTFGYRDSIFKKEMKDKVVITKIKLKLSREGYHTIHSSYGSIASSLDDRQITEPSIQDVSDVIIDIRKSKLPDPEEWPNAGSFFKNPIIDISLFYQLESNFEGIPSYPVSKSEIKIPAGWLIEKCGWKGRRIGNVGTYHKQALVIVNYGTTDGKEILSLSREIQKSVKDTFGILLTPEVNIY